MFARMRIYAITTLTFMSIAHAREDMLFTSSVTYCQPPAALLVQKFNLAYTPRNQSVSFNISAASIDRDLRVSASVLLNVYGMTPANLTLDLCSVLGGALCPLPMYNFTGADSISLPSSLDVSSRIPGIAFKVPDLEGVAQLQLVEQGTGEVKACVQATLSNGWSMFQPAVRTATAIVTVVAFFCAVLLSTASSTIVPERLLDLIYLFQTAASSSFLTLNYPLAYNNFANNFAWAMGLFTSSDMQRSIDHMRHLTGGRMANSTTGTAVEFVNRKLSPYNFFSQNPSSLNVNSFEPSSSAFSTFQSLVTSNSHRSHPVVAGINVLAIAEPEVHTVTTTSTNVLQAGIPIYVNFINIGTANAFMTVFLSALMLTSVILALLALAFLATFAANRWSSAGKDILRGDLPKLSRAWLLRLGLVVLFPLTIFVCYQWTLRDSWLSILLSVIALLAILPCVGYPSFRTIHLARTASPDALWSKSDHLAAHGPLYSQYRIDRYYFFLPMAASSLVKAMVIAFGKSSGAAQAGLLIAVELIGFVAVIALRPYKTKANHAMSIYLSLTRLICSGMLIAFVQGLAVTPIVRTVIGLITALLFSVAMVVVIISLFGNVVSQSIALWRRKTPPVSTSNQIDEEKAHDLRPSNPTPSQDASTGSEHLYPIAPTTPTTVSNISVGLRDSASTHLGSLLPRRWSITPLNSPTNTSTTPHSLNPLSSTPESPALLP